MKKFLVFVFILTIITLGVVGWVKNIIKLSECDFEKAYMAEVIHTVGLIPPIGAVTGYLNVGE